MMATIVRLVGYRSMTFQNGQAVRSFDALIRVLLTAILLIGLAACEGSGTRGGYVGGGAGGNRTSN
jgi:hypothetical protein